MESEWRRQRASKASEDWVEILPEMHSFVILCAYCFTLVFSAQGKIDLVILASVPEITRSLAHPTRKEGTRETLKVVDALVLSC
jgi:hypothetical protein